MAFGGVIIAAAVVIAVAGCPASPASSAAGGSPPAPAAAAMYFPAGGFPREMALEPGGRTLLVTDFSSQQLPAVDVASLP